MIAGLQFVEFRESLHVDSTQMLQFSAEVRDFAFDFVPLGLFVLARLLEDFGDVDSVVLM